MSPWRWVATTVFNEFREGWRELLPLLYILAFLVGVLLPFAWVWWP